MVLQLCAITQYMQDIYAECSNIHLFAARFCLQYSHDDLICYKPNIHNPYWNLSYSIHVSAVGSLCFEGKRILTGNFRLTCAMWSPATTTTVWITVREWGHLLIIHERFCRLKASYFNEYYIPSTANITSYKPSGAPEAARRNLRSLNFKLPAMCGLPTISISPYRKETWKFVWI